MVRKSDGYFPSAFIGAQNVGVNGVHIACYGLTLLSSSECALIDEFGVECLGSSHGATRPVTVQKVMVFCVFHDGDVSGREEFAMAEKDHKPVISAQEEVLDRPRTVSKLKAFWRQRGGVLSGKKPELLQVVGEDCDIFGSNVREDAKGWFCYFLSSFFIQCSVLQE